MAASGDSRRTKIVATIGPATASPEMLAKLIDAGMNGARLNFSHGGHEQHAEVANAIKELQEPGNPVALIADLQGPKLRIAGLEGPRILPTDGEVVVASEPAARDGDLPVAPAVIGDVLEPGHDILIA